MSLFDSGSKGVKFANVGDTITGTISGAPTERQQTKFGSQEPDFWPNGDPKMQIVVPLQTDLREDPQDDGARTLYVASKNMKRAIADAMRAAGANDVVKGGVLSVTFTGFDPNSKNPQNPAKLYQAQYTPPAVTSPFNSTPAAEQQWPQATPQQAPTPAATQPTTTAAPAPQPVASAPAAALTDEQAAKVVQLRAAGIDDQTIATAVGVSIEAIATIPF